MNKAEFARLLEDAVWEARMSVEDLAEAVGVHKSAVYKWLSPKETRQPQGVHLRKLAEVLNAPHLAIGGEELDDRVVEKLTEILDLIRDGMSPARATERALGSVSAEQRERLVAAGSPAVQSLLSAALPADWEALPPADREKAVRGLVAETE